MHSKPDYPLIIAHRGASSCAPENTHAAFIKAVKTDAEGIEFDVRLSADGVPVVFHDPNLKRLAGVDGRISELTSKELSKHDVGSWFNSRYPEKADERYATARIPTLKGTLELLKDFEGIVYIELKCREKEIERLTMAVCREINDDPRSSRIIVKSFKLGVIEIVKRDCPNVKTGALFAPKLKTIVSKEKRLINLSKEIGADFISLHFSLVSAKLMEKARDENLGVAIWTADSSLWIKRGLNLGISHIITNNHAKLLAKRKILLDDQERGRSSSID